MHAHGRTKTSVSAGRLWAGRTLTALPVLFLLFDGVIKLLNLTPVSESFLRLGYRESVAVGIGVLELLCLAAYVVPRTSVLGDILLFLREGRLPALVPLRQHIAH